LLLHRGNTIYIYKILCIIKYKNSTESNQMLLLLLLLLSSFTKKQIEFINVKHIQQYDTFHIMILQKHPLN
jgi:hypothetical protein